MAEFRYSDPHLGTFERFGLNEREMKEVVSNDALAEKWLRYKEKELALFRKYRHSPEQLLLEWTLLEREHPTQKRAETAHRRLDTFILEHFGQCSCGQIPWR